MKIVSQGIAPFGEDICLLACAVAKEGEGAEQEPPGAAGDASGALPAEAPRPEVHGKNLLSAPHL